MCLTWKTKRGHAIRGHHSMDFKEKKIELRYEELKLSNGIERIKWCWGCGDRAEKGRINGLNNTKSRFLKSFESL